MSDLGDLCRAAVEAAAGDEAVESFAEETRRTTVKARAGEVESLSSSDTRGLGVRVIRGGRQGYAYATDPDADAVPELVATARENAELASPDDANAMAAALEADPLPDLFRAAAASLSTERKVALALELERAATSIDPRVRKLEEAAYGDALSRVAVASTGGVDVEYAHTDCWCSAFAMAERDGETQTGYDFRLGRELEELDWRAVAAASAERAARLLGARKPPTERLAVVLDPLAAIAFLGVLSSAISAESVQKGRSLLADRVGDVVASEAVTIVDDGRFLDGPAAAPFDDEGFPTSRTEVVARGSLRGFLHNATTARRGGTSSTGNASRASYRSVPGVAASNLFLEPGNANMDEVLRHAGRAVYVQTVTGVHSGANPVSGEFSVGATGLRVDGAALGEPLREMTIASTLLDMLASVVVVGSDLRFGGALGSPTIVVGDMAVGGT